MGKTYICWETNMEPNSDILYVATYVLYQLIYSL